MKEENRKKIESLELKIEQINEELQAKNKEIEESKKLRKQPEKLAFLGRNTAYILHEMGTPLGVIELANLINIQVLQRLPETESLKEQQSEFTQLLDNCHQIDDSLVRIKQTIDLFSSQAKSDESKPQNCHLKEVISQSLDMTLSSFSVQNKWTVPIQTPTDYDSELIQAQIYSSDFERAMCNLIENSLYSLKQKQKKKPQFQPELSITARQLDKQVQIVVKDNGEGIENEYKTRVFEEFYTTKKEEGTGLGLFLVKQIIESKHGGELTLDTIPDEFTCITITIPNRLKAEEN